MPNGGGPVPPGCDDACQAKIILNGDVSAKVLEATCEAIERHIANSKTFPHGDALIKQANLIEDEVFRFQRMVLEDIGFKGPWPKALEWVKPGQ